MASPNDLTRQQLDELDTLLQRMLSLPLSKVDSAVVPRLADLPLPPPSERSARPGSAVRFEEPPTFLTLAPAPEPAAEYAPVAPEPRPPQTFEPPTGGVGTLRGVDAPATPAGFRSAFAPPPAAEPFPDGFPSVPDVNPFATAAPGASATPPPAPRAEGPGLFAAVALFNRLIEGVLGWCGPLGHWLTRPAVKSALGTVGLLLVVAAAAWAARGLGWVTWPE